MEDKNSEKLLSYYCIFKLLLILFSSFRTVEQ